MASPTERSTLSHEDDTREPWRCDSCGILLFNRDSDGYAIRGAPSSWFGGDYGGKRYEQVCTLCHQMKDILTDGERGNYWRAVQNMEDAKRKARLKKFEESGGGLI